jgi:leucyl/phenylalanyl-tRNA--protein transferase
VAVYRLTSALAFPDPREAEPGGLLAVGGDLAPERLLLAYSLGIFPWYDEPPILWFSPDPRAALAPGELHVSRRLRRTLRQGRFELCLDRDFPAVIRACARVPRRGQQGTWITPEMERAYGRLHEAGFAHSAEAWREGRLVGGAYGVSLGAAFFAESMFHAERDAGKAALAALAWQLDAWSFELLDAQVVHRGVLALGARALSRERFLASLARALEKPTRRGPWRLEPGLVAARAAETPGKEGR